MTAEDVLERLASLGRPEIVESMSRFGITAPRSFGIPTPVLKQFAREVKTEADDRHLLALELWKTGNYDARAVAFLIDDPKLLTREQMDAWAADFDNWATVDGTCSYLFCRSAFAYEKAVEWAGTQPEFVKRAGFALMAYLAIHDKRAADAKLAAFLPIIEEHAGDDRNFVKKAVNWALRQIGKRNQELNQLGVETAKRIISQNTKSARWIGADALRELTSDKTQQRLIPKGASQPRKNTTKTSNS